LGNFARALHHLDMKDVKKKRLEKIAAQKLKEQKDAYEKKIIQEISKNYKSDWKREIYEGMTTVNALAQTLPASDLDNVINDTPTTSADVFDVAPARDPGFSYDAMVGTSIKSSGSGSGSDGGFDIGDHVAFDGTGSTGGARWCVLKAVDTTKVDFMVVSAIVGNGSNGGETPDDTDEGLMLYYKTTDMFDYIPITSHPTLSDFKGGSHVIIPVNIGSYGDTVRDHFVQIPDYARTKDTRFLLYQFNSTAADRDTYGIKSVSYRRLTPINVVVPLSDPEAISFVRVGSDEGDPKKRKKKLNDQLAASDEYTTNVLGNQFPGQGARIDGEDPFRSAPLTPDDEIEGSPIGKGEVKKSFSSFSADAATTEPEPEPIAPSTQTTMNPTNDEGEEINVKPVGGRNSGAVQGADAANLDAQNAQDDAQEPEPTEPEPTEPEPELDPEELKASEEEKQGKTPEEVEEIEREKFNNQFDKQTNFFTKQIIEQADKLLDLPVDKFVDFSVGVIKVLRGINQAGAVLARLGGLIGGLSPEQNDTLKFFETKQTSWEKMINDANIFRSTLTGRIEAQDYSPFQIGKLTKNLNPSQFEGDEFYVEGTGNFGISDTRHEYADDNIYVLNGKVYNNTDGNRRGVYATPLANMGVFTPEIDGIGRGYGQMIIPKDGSAPYFHYYDYNYYNMNSTDKGEVPSKFQQFMADLAGTVRKVLPGRLFNDVVNRFEGNLNTFNNNLKERVGLDGWPPGIHGATLHDFKIPVSDMSEDMQQMIALHPLSWTDERVANMSDDYLYEQANILLDKNNIIYQESDDGKSYFDKIVKILNSREANVDPKFAKAFADNIDQYYKWTEKYNELLEIYKKPEASLAETKSREDWRALQEEQKEATTREELHKKFSKGIKIPNPKTDGDKRPDWSEWIDGDKKEYDELIAQQDKFTKDAFNYYKNTVSSAADKLFAYQGTLKKEGDKVVGTREQITKYRKLAAEYDRTYNEYTRLNALQDEPMNKAGELLSTFLDDYKRRQAVWQPYLNELNRVYKEVYDEYQELVDEAYTKYKNTIGVENKNGETEYVNGGDYTDPSGKTYAGLGTLTSGIEEEMDEINLLMKENGEILNRFDRRYMDEKVSQYLVNREYRGKTTNWSPKNKRKGDDSRSGSDQGYGSGYSISDPIIGSGDRDRRGRPLGESTLFEKLNQKRFFNPNDIKPTFPENPPPQLDPKTGMHPNYGKNAKRYRKLDPISANAMPPTGDPETDALVDKQRTKPKTFAKFKKKLKENFTIVSNGPTNSATQTFQHVSGQNFSFSGLGGQEAHPSTVTVFGDTVPAPNYNQLAIAGYAKPIVMQKKKLEDTNPKLDASQEFAQKVGADVMMNARVKESGKEKSQKNEYTIEKEMKIVDSLMNSIDQFGNVKDQKVLKSASEYNIELKNNQAELNKRVKQIDEYRVKQSEWEKESERNAKIIKGRIKTNISKVNKFLSKYGQKLQSSYPMGAADTRIIDGGRKLVIISHSGFNYSDTKKFNVRVFEAESGKTISKKTGNFGKVSGKGLLDNVYSKGSGSGQATIMYENISGMIEEKDFEIQDVPTKPMPEIPPYLMKNKTLGWYNAPKSIIDNTKDKIQTGDFARNLLGAIGSLISSIPGTDRQGYEGDIEYAAKLTKDMMDGNLTLDKGPQSKSFNKRLLGLISKNPDRNSVGTGDYATDNINQIKELPVRLAIQSFNWNATEEGIVVNDNFDFDFNISGGFLSGLPLGTGKLIQNRIKVISDAMRMRSVELGFNQVENLKGVYKNMPSPEFVVKSSEGGVPTYFDNSEDAIKASLDTNTSPDGFDKDIKILIPWSQVAKDAPALMSKKPLQKQLSGKEKAQRIAKERIAAKKQKTVQTIKKMAKTKSIGFDRDEPIVRRKKKRVDK